MILHRPSLFACFLHVCGKRVASSLTLTSAPSAVPRHTASLATQPLHDQPHTDNPKGNRPMSINDSHGLQHPAPMQPSTARTLAIGGSGAPSLPSPPPFDGNFQRAMIESNQR